MLILTTFRHFAPWADDVGPHREQEMKQRTEFSKLTSRGVIRKRVRYKQCRGQLVHCLALQHLRLDAPILPHLPCGCKPKTWSMTPSAVRIRRSHPHLLNGHFRILYYVTIVRVNAPIGENNPRQCARCCKCVPSTVDYVTVTCQWSTTTSPFHLIQTSDVVNAMPQKFSVSSGKRIAESDPCGEKPNPVGSKQI